MKTRPGMKSLAFTMAAMLALEACGAHVQLPTTPDRTAPLPARVGAYNTLRPTSTQQTQHITVNRYGQVMSASTSLDFLMLADGTQVAYPEDLNPTVDANSTTAQAALRSQSARSTGSWLMAGGLVGSLLGAGLMVPGILNAVGTTDYATGRSEPGDNTLLFTSIGIFSAGLVAYFIGQIGFLSPAASERVRAFSTYDNSLRERLGLCGDGMQMGDCVNAGALAAPPPPPGQ